MQAQQRHSIAPPEVDWNSYVGIPFVPKGRSLEEDGGLDCWGLLRHVLREELKLDVGLFSGEGFDPEGKDWRALQRHLMEASARGWIEQPLHFAQPLDGILMLVAGHPLHVGVVSKRGWMVNTRPGLDESVNERYTTPEWKNRKPRIFRRVELT